LQKSFNFELRIFENIKNTCSTEIENSKHDLDPEKGGEIFCLNDQLIQQ